MGFASHPGITTQAFMRLQKFLLLTVSILCWLITVSCSSQTPQRGPIYPACEPRSVSDPGRLNMQAEAKNFGTIKPCEGTLVLYINPNSEVRAIELELHFLNRDDKLISVDKSTLELEPISTGMFVKRYSHQPIKEAICRELRMSIQSIGCFTSDGTKIDCPDVRVIPPDAFHAIEVKDESLNVCSERS